MARALRRRNMLHVFGWERPVQQAHPAAAHGPPAAHDPAVQAAAAALLTQAERRHRLEVYNLRRGYQRGLDGAEERVQAAEHEVNVLQQRLAADALQRRRLSCRNCTAREIATVFSLCGHAVLCRLCRVIAIDQAVNNGALRVPPIYCNLCRREHQPEEIIDLIL